MLEDLPDDKVLNAREATRELGNVKKYIIERKKWNEKRVRDARAQTSANKKSYDKMHKEFVEKQKKKVKDRLEEKGKLKRQQSLAELTRLLEKSQSQPTADVPVEEPQPGPSHEYTDVTERSTAEEQPEEPVSPPAFENDEDLSEPQIVSPVTSKTRSKMVSPVTSKSRSKEADFPEGLHAKSTRSTRKVSLDTDSGAMKRLGAIMNSLTKLHKKQEAMDEWLSKRDEVGLLPTCLRNVMPSVINLIFNFQAHRKFRRLDRTLLEEIKANVLSLEHKVLKRDKQQELDIALAEKEIHKYLPLNNVGDEADFLFTNAVTTRCISDYIWSSLEAKGKTSPDVGAITREAMVVCFSAYLRAHMYLTRRDTKM